MSIKRLFLAGGIDLTALCPSIKIQHLDPKFQPFARQGKNGRLYLNVVLSNKKEVSNFGFTHTLSCNERGKTPIYVGDFKDFTPKDIPNEGQQVTQQAEPLQQMAQPQPQVQQQQQPVNTPVVDTDSLPF